MTTKRSATPDDDAARMPGASAEPDGMHMMASILLAGMRRHE